MITGICVTNQLCLKLIYFRVS